MSDERPTDLVTLEWVLIEHRFGADILGHPPRMCACGWQAPVGDTRALHRAHVAEALATIVAAARADAWDEGYMRGQSPWRSGSHTEIDPIRRGTSPPTHGRNANPYRAAPAQSDAGGRHE